LRPGDAAALLIQGLIHHFKADVETQVRDFRAREGGVMFGEE
jgi:NADH dehydrogenase (ubiquinone) flavoprotein 1